MQYPDIVLIELPMCMIGTPNSISFIKFLLTLRIIMIIEQILLRNVDIMQH